MRAENSGKLGDRRLVSRFRKLIESIASERPAAGAPILAPGLTTPTEVTAPMPAHGTTHRVSAAGLPCDHCGLPVPDDEPFVVLAAKGGAEHYRRCFHEGCWPSVGLDGIELVFDAPRLAVGVGATCGDLRCDRCDAPVVRSLAVHLRAVCGEAYDRVLHPECWMHVRGALELICDMGHASQVDFEGLAGPAG